MARALKDERCDASVDLPGRARVSFSGRPNFCATPAREMRRVSWPTLVMVRNTTLITLVAVVFFAVYLFAVDRIWTFLIDNLRTALGG